MSNLPISYALGNHFEKLSVHVLPFLLSQTGLYDASALLRNLPGNFADDRTILAAGNLSKSSYPIVIYCQLMTSSAREFLTIS